MKYYFYQALEENPIIAAIKNMDDLELCCSLEEIRVVFVLFGDICTIRTIVKRLKDAGKIAIVHVDLIVGLSSKEIVVDFIKMSTEADGIISTKVPLIRRGNELNFITVQRCFLLDSMAYENLRQAYEKEGLSDEEIDRLLVLDLKPNSYFDGKNVGSYHGGGQLFAYDSDIINWMISRK